MQTRAPLTLRPPGPARLALSAGALPLQRRDAARQAALHEAAAGAAPVAAVAPLPPAAAMAVNPLGW